MQRHLFLSSTVAATVIPVVAAAQAPFSGGSPNEKFNEFMAFLRSRNVKQYATMPPGGIYEEQYVSIGGIEQWVTIHGEDRSNPALLFLHGGPGEATNPWTFIAFAPWLKHFTVVQWDQRGAGRTFEKTGPSIAPTITLDRMLQDGIELANYLCQHLRKRQIFIVGQSFGTILGVMMARKQPDLFAAYIGTGQVGDATRGYYVAYDAMIDYAQSIGDDNAIAELKSVGPPPYKSGAGYQMQRKWSNIFENADQYLPGTIGLTLVAPGGSIQDEINYALASPMSADRLVPQTSTLTESDLGTEFKVPVYIIQGALDFTTPTSLAKNYFDSLRAPRKAFATIPDAGHFAVFTHPRAFLAEFANFVLSD